MANRRFTQFHYSPHTMPTLIDCHIQIGATGAVGTLRGPGVASVTRLAVGTYRVKLQDNYFRLFGIRSWLAAPVTGSDIAVTAISPGTVYQITALGTTTTAQWYTAGLQNGLAPAVGQSFLAAATSTGSGTVKALGNSGVSAVELVGVPSASLNPVGSSLIGGYVTVQCLGATSASVTTMIPVDPVSGSILGLEMYLSNSSVVVQGE